MIPSRIAYSYDLTARFCPPPHDLTVRCDTRALHLTLMEGTNISREYVRMLLFVHDPKVPAACDCRWHDM